MSKYDKPLTMYLLKEKEVCASLNRLGEPLGTTSCSTDVCKRQCCPEPKSTKHRVKDSRSH